MVSEEQVTSDNGPPAGNHRLSAMADAIRGDASAYGRDPAPKRIHKIRVTTRRARALLDSFPPSEQGRRLRNGLKKLARSTSPTRDHDVIDLLVQETVSASADENGVALAPLTDSVRATSIHLRESAAEHLGSSHVQAFLQQLRSFSPTDSETEASDPDSSNDFVFYPKRLRRAYRRWRRKDSRKNLHRMRVAVKRLRYAMTTRHESRAKRSRQVLVKRLERFQDLLGEIRDLHIAAEHVAGVHRENRNSWTSETQAACKQLIDSFENRSQELTGRVKKAYRRANGKKRRRVAKKELAATP